MPKKIENGNDNPERTSKARRVARALAKLPAQSYKRVQEIKAAEDYEKQAYALADDERPERGMLLLRAGQSYLNVSRNQAAVSALEAAQVDLDFYLRISGRQDAYMTNFAVYTALGNAYERRGRPEEAEAARVRAGELRVDIQRLFVPPTPQ